MKMARKALVVVLGDLDRSPRMRYHCKSLASNNYHVTVLASGGGPSGNEPCKELKSYDNIKQYCICENVDFKKPHVIIVQNPPSIPVIPILVIYSKIRGSKLIIDWHNYGFTILRLNFRNRPNHVMVRVYKLAEFFFGRFADAGFCVSKTMQKNLIENFNIKYPIHVLYDKPAEFFKPYNWKEKHNFFLKISEQIKEFGLPVLKGEADWTQRIVEYSRSVSETRFTTTIDKNHAVPKPDRPALIMSSTSWTPDEDFSILFNALEGYDRFMKILHLNRNPMSQSDEYENPYVTPPRIICVITGKGPMKEYWKNKIKQCNFLFVEIVLPWLETEDYAAMVASSDLGISLHQSSSGLDLPMKVVDMFGCGIPVLAYRYQTISELVRNDFYGKTFITNIQLEDILKQILLNLHDCDSCPSNDGEQFDLNRYKKNIRRHFLIKNWNSNWVQVARPVIDSL